MSVRVIIAAAGSGVRWGNFRGTPKHLAIVEGEVLLERTVKQFLKYFNQVIYFNTFFVGQFFNIF